MLKASVFLSFFLLPCLLLFSQQDTFTPETLWKLKRLNGCAVSPDESKVIYTVSHYDIIKNSSETDVYILDIESRKSKKINSHHLKMNNPQWLSDNRIVFIEETNNGQQLTSVNFNGGDKTVIGQFDKSKVLDFKFSPKENFLVTLQRVKTGQSIRDKHSDLPLANARIEDELLYRHWDSWRDEYSKHLFLYTVNEGKINGGGIDIQRGEAFDGVLAPFGNLSGVNFSIDEDMLVYTSKKMNPTDYARSTNSDLYAYTILKGETKNLTADYKGYDTQPCFSPESNQLAWLSMEKDGFEADKNDIIVRDLSTNEDINITKDIDLTVSSFKWSKDGKYIYFKATDQATTQLFEIKLKNGKYKKITDGIHDYVDFDQVDKSFIAVRQSMLVPNDLYEVKIKNGDTEQVTTINADILNNLQKPTIEKRWVSTTDNKKMLTWVILPPGFDETKKYPALLYCQGGPQSAVSQFFSFRWNLRLMASQGYVVIAPNRRGLPSFGQEWNDAISKDWGGQPMQDYLAAVDAVTTEKYVDETRIGAVGASYGGFSVFYLAGIHENRFKTFISHCGLFNMTSWYGTTEELFFADWELGGPYWEPKNSDFYENHSPHKKVNNWDTPILIIQGGRDFRVPESQSFEAYQAAKLKGLNSKLLYFPDENHWILQPQNAILWQREFFKWLTETL